jgi:hypothetical protein
MGLFQDDCAAGSLQRPRDAQRCRIKVKILPAQPEQLATSQSECQRQPVQRRQPAAVCGRQQRSRFLRREWLALGRAVPWRVPDDPASPTDHPTRQSDEGDPT